MENIDKMAGLLYRAYEEKHVKDRVEIEGLDESFKKLSDMLNDKQRQALHEYDFLELELLIENQKHAIKYILELLCPEF